MEKVSLWTKWILETSVKEIALYDLADKNVQKTNNKYLRQIAAINLKKYDGKSTSKIENLDLHVKKHKELLRKQIELCDPTIIVCGNTAKQLAQIFDKEYKEYVKGKYYFYMQINGHDVMILNYWHPSNQFPNIMNYYCLTNIYQKALNDKKR